MDLIVSFAVYGVELFLILMAMVSAYAAYQGAQDEDGGAVLVCSGLVVLFVLVLIGIHAAARASGL